MVKRCRNCGPGGYRGGRGGEHGGGGCSMCRQALDQSRIALERVDQLQTSMGALVGMVQRQQQFLLGGAMPDDGSIPLDAPGNPGVPTLSELWNSANGYAPDAPLNNAPTPGTNAQTGSTPPEPVDPAAVTVAVPTIGNLTDPKLKIDGITALQTACTASDPTAKNAAMPEMTNQEVRDQYNESRMLYDPNTKKFYRTYCDALAGTNGSASAIQVVDESQFQSRLRNAGERGPYTDDEIASSVAKTKKPTSGRFKKCPSQREGQQMSCPPNMVRNRAGECWDPKSKMQYRTFPNEMRPPFQDPTGKWVVDWCEDQALPARSITGNAPETAAPNYPVYFGEQPLWLIGNQPSGS